MKFKLGDKVKIRDKIRDRELRDLQPGDIGTIIEIDAKNECVYVEWKNPRFAWWVMNEDVRTLDEPNHPYTNIFK